MSKRKKTAPLFLFLEGHMHLYPSVHFHAKDLLKQYFKMKLNELETKYTDSLIFNFEPIIYPQRSIMPL